MLCQGLAEQLPHNNLQEERSSAREEAHCLEALGGKGKKDRERKTEKVVSSIIQPPGLQCFFFRNVKTKKKSASLVPMNPS